mgnify:CR=1 FL=1
MRARELLRRELDCVALGAGGPAAVGVIKSFNDFDTQGEHKIVAIDCDELSVGFHLADRHYVVPFSVEDNYWKEVLKIIRKDLKKEP